MILVQCTNSAKPSDFVLVAQNPVTYELLGFSVSGTPVTDYSAFDGHGRYKPRDGSLPALEVDLRTEFFTLYKTQQLAQAKVVRDAGKVAPLEYLTNSFDLDKEAQININTTLDDFEAVRLAAVAMGWVDDSTVPWVTEDNLPVALTVNDLAAIKTAAATRGMRLHLTYNARRVELDALIPME